MTTSRTDITVTGLELSVYGLKEYNQLDQGSPVAVLFAMHGRLQTKDNMESIAQVVCSLNGHKGGKQLDRHVLVVTFDHYNHGTRLVDNKRNQSWKKTGKNNNPTHAMDQWHMLADAASTVSSLIDVLEFYLFGPDVNPVERWGCLGYSMGAHASFLVAKDPRISVQIALVGASDFIGLLEARLVNGDFPLEYLPKGFSTMVKDHYDLEERLTTKKVLMINGADDTMVPPRFNDRLVNAFPPQAENKTWARWVLPDVGHSWHPTMYHLASRWCRQWLIMEDPQFSLYP